MGLFSLEKLFGMTIRESANDGSDFTNPDADYRRLFLGEDGQLHVKDSAGAVTDIGGAVTEITDLPTADTTTTNVLSPDGAGGVEWRAESGTTVGSTLQSINRTAGNLTLAANVTTMTEVSSALRLTVAAATGDVLMVGLSSLLTQGGGSEAMLDSATIVSGSIVNQMSPGTKHVGHGYTGTALRDVGVSVVYVVQSGDISGGNVTVSLTYINADPAATGLLRAASDYALRYWVVNLGQ